MTVPNGRVLLVGLGNPGARYAGNRHNVGFMAVDTIAASRGFSPFRRRFQGDVGEGSIGRRACLVLKPLTFMNESGRAVGELCRFYKIDAGDVFVFHDDLDIAPGRVRVKRGGGNAGHNGLKSLDAHIGPDYWRVRLGIGHPGERSRVHGYVLSDFATADRSWLEPLLEAMASHVALLIAGDGAGFTSRVALALQPVRAPRESAPEGDALGSPVGTAGRGKPNQGDG
jgi:PTH1 family peptidyl-tRNA hydrolase